MATKKSATVTKKPASKKPASSAAAKTTTKVTTVKAESASARVSKRNFNFSRSPLLGAAVAEFVGTFMLAAIVLASSGSAIVVFFAVIAITLAVGAVSGAHLNPAMTIGAWATRRVSSVRAVSYLVAQVLGAILALVVVNSYVTATPAVSEQAMMMGQQAPSLFEIAKLPQGKEWLVLGAELLGTTIFAFGFAAALKDRSRIANAFGIGGALFIGLAVSGYLVSLIGSNGAVLNPAVAGAVQALKWDWWAIFAYVVAPVVGGVIGFALRDLLNDEAA